MAASSMKTTVRWAGDAMFLAFSPAGHAQAIETNSRRASAATPVEMLLMALGGCTGADVVSILEKQRLKVSGYEVIVTGERGEEHPRKFDKIHTHHVLRGKALPEKAVARAIELSETKYCSVTAALRPGAEITSSFEIVADIETES